jgi:single-strand DNA-binding protein
MAGSLNKVALIGNVGKDPEIRTMNNGNRVASFSMAMTDSWKDKGGEKKEKTEWANVVCFNDGLIGVIDSYVSKGSKLYVEGKLQTRKYEKDGSDRYITEVVLDFGAQLILLGDKGGSRDDSRDNGRDDRRGGGSSGGYEDRSRSAPKEDFPLDDEIPFASPWGLR